jgi:small-conductance mechanosensitive channel
MQTDDAIDIVRSSATTVLEQVYLGNTVRNWVIAAVVFAVTLGAIVLVRWLVVRKLASMADRTRTHVDEYVVALLRHTRYTFLVMLALAPALAVLVLPERIAALITPLLRLVVIVQVGLWIGELVTLHLQNLTTQRAATDVASVTTIRTVGLLARLVLWVVIFLLALRNFGVDVTALLTTLGIAGIAAALAVQNILGDLLASLSIVLDKPFVVGDSITVDQYSGTVEEIGLKTTRIRALSGERLIFSNADLLRSRIRNYRDMTRRRIVFSFGLEYGTGREVLERIPDVVRETITAIDQTSFDRCHFQKFGESSLDFETVYFVLVPDYNRYMDIQQRINLELYDRFAELGTGFAFPTRMLIVENGEGPGTRRAGAEPLKNAALPASPLP